MKSQAKKPNFLLIVVDDMDIQTVSLSAGKFVPPLWSNWRKKGFRFPIP